MLKQKLMDAVGKSKYYARQAKKLATYQKEIDEDNDKYPYVVVLGADNMMHRQPKFFLCGRYDQTLHFYSLSQATGQQIKDGCDEYGSRYALTEKEADRFIKRLNKLSLNHPVKMLRKDFVKTYFDHSNAKSKSKPLFRFSVKK